MTGHTEKKCPYCGQMLRIPSNKGGITMVCPSCGNKIDSDFILGGVRKNTGKNIFVTIFEMPSWVFNFVMRIFSSRS
jgi:uncharacterized protein (UPF0212 family)